MKRIKVESNETVRRTLTVGKQSVTLNIVGKNVSAVDGTPETLAIVREVLALVSPTPSGVGRGKGQAGRKRGAYKPRQPKTEQTANQNAEQ